MNPDKPDSGALLTFYTRNMSLLTGLEMFAGCGIYKYAAPDGARERAWIYRETCGLGGPRYSRLGSLRYGNSTSLWKIGLSET